MLHVIVRVMSMGRSLRTTKCVLKPHPCSHWTMKKHKNCMYFYTINVKRSQATQHISLDRQPKICIPWDSHSVWPFVHLLSRYSPSLQMMILRQMQRKGATVRKARISHLAQVWDMKYLPLKAYLLTFYRQRLRDV